MNDLEVKRERRLYRRMFDRLLWEYAHRPDCYYCPFGQFCPQWKAGAKPDASECMNYIEAEIRKICEEEISHDEEHESTD